MRSALILLLLPAFGGLTGCQTHQCDASSVTVDDSDGGPVPLIHSGNQVIWFSAPFEGPWLDFPGLATITFKLPPGLGEPDEVESWVSTAPYQDAGTWTSGVGQLVEGNNPDSHTLALTNSTCAEYFLRVKAVWTVDAGVADASRD